MVVCCHDCTATPLKPPRRHTKAVRDKLTGHVLRVLLLDVLGFVAVGLLTRARVHLVRPDRGQCIIYAVCVRALHPPELFAPERVRARAASEKAYSSAAPDGSGQDHGLLLYASALTDGALTGAVVRAGAEGRENPFPHATGRELTTLSHEIRVRKQRPRVGKGLEACRWRDGVPQNNLTIVVQQEDAPV